MYLPVLFEEQLFCFIEIHNLSMPGVRSRLYKLEYGDFLMIATGQIV